LGCLKAIVVSVAQHLQIEQGDPNRWNNLLTEDFTLDLGRLNAIGSAATQDLRTKCRDYTRRKDVFTKYLALDPCYVSAVGRTTPQYLDGCTSGIQPYRSATAEDFQCGTSGEEGHTCSTPICMAAISAGVQSVPVAGLY